MRRKWYLLSTLSKSDTLKQIFEKAELKAAASQKEEFLRESTRFEKSRAAASAERRKLKQERDEVALWHYFHFLFFKRLR